MKFIRIVQASGFWTSQCFRRTWDASLLGMIAALLLSMTFSPPSSSAAEHFHGPAPLHPAPPPPNNLVNCSIRGHELDLPEFHIRVAYHFLADSSGRRFQCSNPSGAFYAPPKINAILSIANDYFTNPRLNEIGNPGRVADTRFRWPSQMDCTNAYFHPFGAKVEPIPGMLNIVFSEPNTSAAGGRGGNPMQIYNALENINRSDFGAIFGRLLNHEFGHNMGLPHAFSSFNDCDDMICEEECGGPSCSGGDCPEDPDACYPLSAGGDKDLCCYCTRNTGNNFMGYSQEQNAITPCQWEKMISDLIENPKEYIDLCIPEEADLSISQSTVWDYPRFLNRNVTVETGACLTISCVTMMGEGKRIVVKRGAKLILDGGRITNLCPKTYWEGIYVEGNGDLAQAPLERIPRANVLPLPNQSGVIYGIGGSIEHARTAVSTLRWYDRGNPKLWGGMVVMRGTSFLGNHRGVAFYAYYFPNNSLFDGARFMGQSGFYQNDSDVGVSIWACEGIGFTDNLFSQLRNGVRGTDYSVTSMDGNRFDLCYHGVEIYASAPLTAELQMGTRRRNFFTAGRNNEGTVGLIAESVKGATDLYIRDNEFRGHGLGATVQGPSYYTIAENEFMSLVGSAASQSELNGMLIQNCGDNANNIICNFYDVDAGLRFADNNRWTRFLGNEFDTEYYDITIDGNGSGRGRVAISQGSERASAGNCFTQKENHIHINSRASHRFNYYHGSNDADCLEEPAYQVGNLHRLFFTTRRFKYCEDIPPPQIPDPKKEELDLLYTDIKELTAQLSNQPEDSLVQMELDEKNLAKDQLLLEFVQQGIWQEDVSQATAILQNDGSTEAQRLLLGLALHQGKFEMAQQALDGLSMESEDNQIFKDIQQINIRRLQQGPDFVLSDEESVFLNDIAYHSKYADRSSARALLVILEDAFFEYSMGGEAAQARSGASQAPAPVDLQVYPNPVRDLLHIELSKELLSQGQITIVDINGRPIHQQKVSMDASAPTWKESISTLFWPRGVYILTVSDANTGATIASRKLTLIR
ncbi:MAG: T9SS type A sorting domain-containing protein [Bacteroidota bacterium]